MGGKRHRSTRPSADFIRKDPIDFDACEIFYVGEMPTREWKQRNRNAAGLFQPDPFGVNDYFVDYSLNKKKRWTISEEIKERIGEVQDDHLNIRVSASVHNLNQPRTNDKLHREPQNRLPCLEYHSTTRDGEVIHKESKRGRTRLRNFTHGAQAPKRSTDGVDRPFYSERHDRSDRYLLVDENLEHQKLHVHYTTLLHTAEPYKKATTITRKPVLSKSRKFANLIDTSDVEDLEVDDNELFAADIEEPFLIPTVVGDLSSLVVRKEKRRRVGRKIPAPRFVDETLKPFFDPASTINGTVDDFEDAEIALPSVHQCSLPPEMLIRIPFSADLQLESANRLPCYPPAWEIHRKDSERVLGTSLLTCVIARRYGDELRLSIVNDCPSSYPSRLHLPPSVEVPPEIDNVEGEWCDICWGAMDLEFEDRQAHPFALSCSHLFCNECWLKHISQSIHSKKLPAACLHPDCSNTLSIPAAKGLLSSSSLEIYEAASINALKAAGKVVQCPECARLLDSTGSLTISCPCGASLCSHCLSIAHSPFSCDVFEQYNKYMMSSGFDAVYSTHSSMPIIRELTKCPKCSTLMQRSQGCNHMTCNCGTSFCYVCGSDLNDHKSCKKKQYTVTMTDVIKPSTAPLLLPSQLIRAVNNRIDLLERRKVLRKRLLGLPFSEKKVCEMTFVQLSLLVELCGIVRDFDERKSRREMVKRVRSWLDDFLHTDPKQDISKRGRELKQFQDSLII